MRTIRRAVVIGNGVAGAENQCIGLVRALGLSQSYALYRVTRPSGGINDWLRSLPVSLHKNLHYVMNKFVPCGNITLQGKASSSGYGTGFSGVIKEAEAHCIANLARETFEKDGPTLLVASGRDTISVASSIKRLAPENVFAVQIQHPRSRLNRFDLVITPRHDYYSLTPEGRQQIPWFLWWWITPREPPDRNVVLTLGALHQADSTALKTAACIWHDKLALLPKPLLVVNIGGPTKLQSSYEQVSDILLRILGSNPKVSVWNGEDPNPHLGHLAWADAFIITADSISMLSEACSTGKPVYVIGMERCMWKFAGFHKSLRDRGFARPFTGKENMSERRNYCPLKDTEEAACQVIKAIAERGWRLPLNDSTVDGLLIT